MAKIGLFYGTQTGNTETVSELIQKEFGGESVVELEEICNADPSDFSNYDCIIVGCPTWNVGELQSDWEGFYEDLDAINFSGKKVAYFGAGDQVGYADNFQDAIGILEEKISSLGGKLSVIGRRMAMILMGQKRLKMVSLSDWRSMKIISLI